MPSDKRQKAIDRLTKKIASGKKLTEKEVQEVLFLARDHMLLYIARDTMAGKVPDKGRLSTFGSLQNACERHEMLHQDEGQLDENKIRRVEVTLKCGDE